MEPKHWSSCAVYNAPAYPPGPCDCGGFKPTEPREAEPEPAEEAPSQKENDEPGDPNDPRCPSP